MTLTKNVTYLLLHMILNGGRTGTSGYISALSEMIVEHPHEKLPSSDLNIACRFVAYYDNRRGQCPGKSL